MNLAGFDKGKALQLMIQGFQMVPSSWLSKKSYHGSHYTYNAGAFVLVGTSNKKVEVNNLVNKYWSIATITSSFVPQILYKVNLEKGELYKLQFQSILKNDLDEYNKVSFIIAEYSDEERNTISVKIVFKTNIPRHAKRNLTLNDYFFDFGGNVFEDISVAKNVLKEFVIEETTKQRKRPISKGELPTMKTVRHIITKYPEVLV